MTTPEPAASATHLLRQRRARSPSFAATCLTLLLAVFAVGCRTKYQTAALEAGDLYAAGQLQEAAEKLRATLQGAPGETALRLDLATVLLATGDVDGALQQWRTARDEIDSHADAAAGDAVKAVALDDAVRHYQAPGHEQVMCRVMLALASLAGDATDAHSFALQAQQRQEELRHRSEANGADASDSYRPLAIASYLQGTLAESTWHDFDGAARAYRLVSQARPQLRSIHDDLQRAQHGVPCAQGHGVVYVVAMVGRGPARVPREETVTSDALLVADRIVSALGTYSVPPTLAPIRVPAVVVPGGPPTSIIATLDGVRLGETATVTDVGELALRAWEAERAVVVGRAVARRIIKKAAVVAAKDAIGIQHPLGQLAFDLAGSAWEATERVDTRCWQTLPREIQIARCELPVGVHEIQLQTASGGRSGTPAVCRCNVRDAESAYLIAFAPGNAVQSVVASR